MNIDLSERERHILLACLGKCITLTDDAFFIGYFVHEGDPPLSFDEVNALVRRLHSDTEEG
jgi:hypothetical protein